MRKVNNIIFCYPYFFKKIIEKAKFIYSRQKYYCYHQNAKYFLLPFENGNFSIAQQIVIAYPTIVTAIVVALKGVSEEKQ